MPAQYNNILLFLIHCEYMNNTSYEVSPINDLMRFSYSYVKFDLLITNELYHFKDYLKFA